MAAGLLTNKSTVKFELAAVATTPSYTEIKGLQSIPSLGGEPEKIDITTLSDEQFHYMTGLRDFGDLEFQFLYIPSTASPAVDSNYETATGFDDGTEKMIQITIADGSTFTMNGTVAVSLNEANVNEAYTFTITIGLTSDITASLQ